RPSKIPSRFDLAMNSGALRWRAGVASSSRNRSSTSRLNDGRRSLASRSFAGMTTSIGEDPRWAYAVRWRGLGIEGELAHQAGHGKPGAVFDGDAGMGTQSPFASGHRQPLVL